jgi:hypothetical protein
MKLGIFGYPKVGKTTLFNLLTHLSAATDKFATAHAGPNVGVARVTDPRVDRLSELFRPRKTTHATIEYVDVAGIKTGELKESVDLAALRPVDALVHVVRAFDDAEIEHAPGPIDPRRDMEAMETELTLTDLITVEKRLERLELDIKKKGRDAAMVQEHEALGALRLALEEGRPARSVALDAEVERRLRGFQFLSAKPLLHVVNLGEERQDAHRDIVAHFHLEALAAHPRTAITWVVGKLEMEIGQLDPADARAFLADLGLSESGIDRLVRTSYGLLGLVSFFTVGEDEVRAWTIHQGTPAVRAAGTIHSDLERGFIRAEVMRHEDLLARGSEKAVRDAGLHRLEGKDYVVQDGDVVHVRFNV